MLVKLVSSVDRNDQMKKKKRKLNQLFTLFSKIRWIVVESFQAGPTN